MGHKLNTLAVDYESIRTELINILGQYNLIKDFHKSSVGITLIEMIAYVTELINFYINEAKTEMTVEFAQRRESLLEMARAAGYYYYFGAPSRGYVNLTFNVPLSAGQTIEIPQYTYLKSRNGINFMVADSYSFTSAIASATIPIRQGILRQNTLGYSNGDNFQRFKIPSQFVTIPIKTDKYVTEPILYIKASTPAGGDEYYYYKESLILSLYTDTDFSIDLDEENYCWVRFGDNVFGKVPAAGSKIDIFYEENVGSLGNIEGIDLDQFNTNQYATYNTTKNLDDATTTLSAQNFFNGRDPDDDETIRNRINSFIRMQNRTITKDDYITNMSLHKGMIRASATTFSDIFKICSRNYTIEGSYINLENFTSASNDISASIRDVRFYYDNPQDLFNWVSDANTQLYKNTLSAEAINGFTINANELWYWIAAGGNANTSGYLTYYPDYASQTSFAVGASAMLSSQSGEGKAGAWLDRIIWASDLLAASSVNHERGCFILPQNSQDLNDWIDYIAPPAININHLYKIPSWIFTNINFNVELDPNFYGDRQVLCANVAKVLDEKFGFKTKFRNSYVIDFGSKIYLNEIENDVLNSVPGIKSLNIPGIPDNMLAYTASAASGNLSISTTGLVTGGKALCMWTPKTTSTSEGIMCAVYANEYYSNHPSGNATLYPEKINTSDPSTANHVTGGQAVYTSAHSVFWNPEERSLQFKVNQMPIILLSGITFT